MLVQPAEDCFQKALQALSQGSRREALALFEASIQLERRFGVKRPQARYLSYYGLCLAMDRHDVREGLRYCREAVNLEGYNPDIRCNLGRVLLAAGRRKQAHQAFSHGLRLQPDHRGIIQAMRKMGVRRRPVLPFLSRANPINILLGRLRLSRFLNGELWELRRRPSRPSPT